MILDAQVHRMRNSIRLCCNVYAAIETEKREILLYAKHCGGHSLIPGCMICQNRVAVTGKMSKSSPLHEALPKVNRKMSPDSLGIKGVDNRAYFMK